MKSINFGFLFALIISIAGYAGSAQSQNFFTAEQEASIQQISLELSLAMGSAAIDPLSNCNGLREQLKLKLEDIQPLVEIASKLPTDIYSDLSVARNILDAELAVQYVDKTCSAHGV